MAINYAERFERQIEQQFARELTSADMATNRRFNFIDAQTIKVPTVTLSGYKDHARDGSKNRGTVGNTFRAFTLTTTETLNSLLMKWMLMKLIRC